MRPLADLRFIAARVIAEVRATPPSGPLLTEPRGPRARKTACKNGHADAGRTKSRQCRACERERKRRDRRNAR